MHEARAQAGIRLDKWLWAARFFKTRALAAEAVAGGKVRVNGARAKPARLLNPGDRLHVRRGAGEWELVVRALSAQRRAAAEAALLYEETPESRAAREAFYAALKAQGAMGAAPAHRPNKRERRQLLKFSGKGR